MMCIAGGTFLAECRLRPESEDRFRRRLHVSYRVSNKHRFEAEGGEERPCMHMFGHSNVTHTITIKRMHESTMHLTVENTTPVHRTI